MAKLVLVLPDGSTRDIALSQQRMMIGRRPDNDICLNNLAVSGTHAAVVTILADSFLEDLGSTNGTLVNGKAVGKHFLRERDDIDVGRHRLVYCSDDATVLPIEALTGSLSAAGNLGEMVEHAKPKSAPSRSTKHAASSLKATKNGADAGAAAHDTGSNRAGNGAAHTDVADSDDDAARVPPGGPAVDAEQPQGAAAAREQAFVPAPAASVAWLKVITGTHPGRTVSLTKEETTVGRAGLQAALIVRTGSSYVLKPIEGEKPPVVNGMRVGVDGQKLFAGDFIDIADSKLEYIGPA